MSDDKLMLTRRGFVTGATLAIGCLAAPKLSLADEMSEEEIQDYIDKHAQKMNDEGKYLEILQLNSPYSVYADAGNVEFIETTAEDGSTIHAIKASGLLGWLDDTTVYDGALYISLGISAEQEPDGYILLAHMPKSKSLIAAHQMIFAFLPLRRVTYTPGKPLSVPICQNVRSLPTTNPWMTTYYATLSSLIRKSPTGCEPSSISNGTMIRLYGASCPLAADN